MTERYPDIEIYIKGATPADIRGLLAAHFSIDAESSNGTTTRFVLSPGDIECVVVENAGPGGFTSVWFKSPHTPWDDDLACARDAFAHLGLEVRCSGGSWHEGEAEDTGDTWHSISDRGERTVTWR